MHLAALKRAKSTIENDARQAERYSASLYPVANILHILALYLEAATATHSDEAIPLLKQAASIEFYYDEPPSLFFPPEILLGLCLKGAQRKSVLMAALDDHTSNQWAIDGLNGHVGTFLENADQTR